MSPKDKPLVWMHGEVKTPPFSKLARLQPHSRPMPSIGRRCHELRVSDDKVSWRIVYRIDEDAIVILEVFSKKTGKTPKSIIDICRTRLREYDHG
jgi:phage-related protein